jgi:hypothetical protein
MVRAAPTLPGAPDPGRRPGGPMCTTLVSVDDVTKSQYAAASRRRFPSVTNHHSILPDVQRRQPVNETARPVRCCNACRRRASGTGDFRSDSPTKRDTAQSTSGQCVTFAPAPKIFVELPFNDPAHFAQAAWYFGGLGIFELGRVTSVGRRSSTMPRFAPEAASAIAVAAHPDISTDVSTSSTPRPPP